MGDQQQFSPKSFAVIGAGPVGCIVAAYLAKGGFKVTLCDVMPELLEPAKSRGIILEGAENFEQTIDKTLTNVDELADDLPDVIFVTVKALATPFLAGAIEGFYKEGTYVVSWQNGIDTELAIADHLGKEPVLRAVVNYGCALKAPAHVIIPFHHPPHFIQELDLDTKHVAIGIAKTLTSCGIVTERADDLVSKIWRKTIMNACMNPVCAVTGYTMSEAMKDPMVFRIVDNLVKECNRVARANEIQLGWDYYRYCMDYMMSAGSHKPSMLMDIEKKRRTEVDFINGKFIEYGDQAGVDTPYNLTIRNLVKALESKF